MTEGSFSEFTMFANDSNELIISLINDGFVDKNISPSSIQTDHKSKPERYEINICIL